MPDSQNSPRKPRADALRNREHLIAVAREAFAQDGAAVTLEDIVKRSGVGVGTLYRHFRTRDALIEAVYISEVQRLSAAAGELAETLPPVEALRQWMRLFVDHLTTKHAMKEALNAMVGGTEALYASTTELMRAAIDNLTTRAVATGEIRLDMDPLDLLRAVAGVAVVGDENAYRVIDILLAGLRPGPKA